VSTEAQQAAPIGDQIVEGKQSPGLADREPATQGEETTGTESEEGAANGRGGLGGRSEEGTGDAAGSPGHAGEAEALGARIAAEVEALKSYPEAARRRGTEGTVRLRLSVTADGKLEAARIEESSGSPLLDRAAIRLVSSIFPLDNPARRELEFFLAIRYSISAAGKL
jgi:protein TonB